MSTPMSMSILKDPFKPEWPESPPFTSEASPFVAITLDHPYTKAAPIIWRLPPTLRTSYPSLECLFPLPYPEKDKRPVSIAKTLIECSEPDLEAYAEAAGAPDPTRLIPTALRPMYETQLGAIIESMKERLGEVDRVKAEEAEKESKAKLRTNAQAVREAVKEATKTHSNIKNKTSKTTSNNVRVRIFGAAAIAVPTSVAGRGAGGQGQGVPGGGGVSWGLAATANGVSPASKKKKTPKCPKTPKAKKL